MDIQEIGYSVNAGPGIARQFGIDNTSCPFIMFADADDSFATPLALEILLNEIKNHPKTSVVIGRALVVDRELKLKLQPMQYSLTPVHGKIYRRFFLQENNIKFLNSRSNEDAGFNHLIYLLTNKEEEPVFLDCGVYCWEENSNSLTANDNFKYKLNLPGFVDNMIYAIKKANLMPNKSNYKIIKLSIEVMVDIYLYYEELKFTNNNLPKENFEAAVKFYNEIYRVVEEKTSQKNSRKTHFRRIY